MKHSKGLKTLREKCEFTIYVYITNALEIGWPVEAISLRLLIIKTIYNFEMKKYTPLFIAAALHALMLIGIASANIVFAESISFRQVLQQGTVMGFRHYEGKQVWEQLRIGQSLTLMREPENPHDAQAIRVEWNGHKLGYVPRADNSDLARLIDNGTAVEARISKLEKSRRPNNRVRFEIYLQ